MKKYVLYIYVKKKKKKYRYTSRNSFRNDSLIRLHNNFINEIIEVKQTLRNFIFFRKSYRLQPFPRTQSYKNKLFTIFHINS